MNKKGFTILELLAVILIVGIVSLIASFGIEKLVSRENDEGLKAQKELILNASQLYANDISNNLNDTCLIDGLNLKCEKITVQDLIDMHYFTRSKKCGDEKKCVMEDTVICIYSKNGFTYVDFLNDLK